MNMRPNYFGFSTDSSFLEGVLPFMAPAWLAWIVSGLALNAVVHYKSHLPKAVTDIMEYGKLRKKQQALGTLSLFSLPKG